MWNQCTSVKNGVIALDHKLFGWRCYLFKVFYSPAPTLSEGVSIISSALVKGEVGA